LANAPLTSVIGIAAVASATRFTGTSAAGARAVEAAQPGRASLLPAEYATRETFVAARIAGIGAAPLAVGIADALLLLCDVLAAVIAATSDDDEREDGKARRDRGADSTAALWLTRRILRRTAVLNDETHGTPP
jgi:hypothetical protein